MNIEYGKYMNPYNNKKLRLRLIRNIKDRMGLYKKNPVLSCMEEITKFYNDMVENVEQIKEGI